MSTTVPLREIAHARAGDKGDCSNVCVFVYDMAHYECVASQLTPKRLKDELGDLFKGAVKRYNLPHLGGFNFVVQEALEGGVNRSLNLDGHGKSWSFLLLDLMIDIDV